jgi:hypothetical protein
LNITWKETLRDTLITTFTIGFRDAKDDHFKHLQTGISNIGNFILTRFTIEEALICAAKTSYMGIILQLDEPSEIERFSNPAQIRYLEITNPDFNKLNKLKKTNPESFFYFYNALKTVQFITG